jgi:hypothetical protein
MQDHTGKGPALPLGKQGIMITVENGDFMRGGQEAVNILSEVSISLAGHHMPRQYIASFRAHFTDIPQHTPLNPSIQFALVCLCWTARHPTRTEVTAETFHAEQSMQAVPSPTVWR